MLYTLDTWCALCSVKTKAVPALPTLRTVFSPDRPHNTARIAVARPSAQKPSPHSTPGVTESASPDRRRRRSGAGETAASGLKATALKAGNRATASVSVSAVQAPDTAEDGMIASALGDAGLAGPVEECGAGGDVQACLGDGGSVAARTASIHDLSGEHSTDDRYQSNEGSDCDTGNEEEEEEEEEIVVIVPCEEEQSPHAGESSDARSDGVAAVAACGDGSGQGESSATLLSTPARNRSRADHKMKLRPEIEDWAAILRWPLLAPVTCIPAAYVIASFYLCACAVTYTALTLLCCADAVVLC